MWVRTRAWPSKGNPPKFRHQNRFFRCLNGKNLTLGLKNTVRKIITWVLHWRNQFYTKICMLIFQRYIVRRKRKWSLAFITVDHYLLKMKKSNRAVWSNNNECVHDMMQKICLGIIHRSVWILYSCKLYSCACIKMLIKIMRVTMFF